MKQMKFMSLGVEREQDKYSHAGSRSMPFVMAFLYFPAGEPVCVKGSSHLVQAYVKEHFGNQPHIQHTTYWQNGCRAYTIWIALPGTGVYLAKKHHRDEVSSYSFNPPNKHEQWILYTHNQSPVGGHQHTVLATFRKPPRGWIKQLNQFLPKST